MRPHLFALILCIAPLVLSAQAVEIGSTSVREAVDRATAATLDSMFAALTARDADRLMRFYAQDASVLHVSDMRIIRTDTIAPYTARGLAALERFEVTWTPHGLQVLTPDIAVRTVLLTFTTTPRGEPARSSSGVQTLVMKRSPQGWKVVGDHRTMQALQPPLQQSQVQAAPDHAATIRAARALHNELLRTLRLDSAATFWTHDLVVLTSLGARFDGPSAMRDAFAGDTSVLYHRTPIEVGPSAHWPIAWERGTWVGLLRSDTTVTTMTGWYSARWLHEDGRWRIQSEQFVADACDSVGCDRPLAARRPAVTGASKDP